MAVTWGEPEIANTTAMQGPQQINAVADFAMVRGIRPFDTVAALRFATGMEEGYWASVKNVPGALWRYTSGAWVMVGEPRFASVAARDAALTAPVADMRIYRTDKRYSQVYTGSAWVVAGGLVPIRPTAVSGSGVTVSADGTINLSASPDLSRFDGLFSADFDSYEIHWKLGGSVAAEIFGFRLSTGGTVDSSTNYVYEGVYSRSKDASTGRWASSGQSYWDVSRLDSDTSKRRTSGRMTINAPFPSSDATSMSFQASGLDNGLLGTTASGFQNLAKSFDGIAVVSSTSSITGSLRVYGVGKA